MNLSFTPCGGNCSFAETERKFGMIPRIRLVCFPSRLVVTESDCGCAELCGACGMPDFLSSLSAGSWDDVVALGASGSAAPLLMSRWANATGSRQEANTAMHSTPLAGKDENNSNKSILATRFPAAVLDQTTTCRNPPSAASSRTSNEG